LERAKFSAACHTQEIWLSLKQREFSTLKKVKGGVNSERKADEIGPAI
jgi:hypothetical protein